jgi:hypothetical protein
LEDRHEAEETLKAQGALVRAAYPNCEWVMRSGDAGKGILEMSRLNLAWISSSYSLTTTIGTTAIARPILLIISCATRDNRAGE